MKQCPSCRTTYTDVTLSFCLADGTPLIDVAEEATVAGSGRGEPMRVEIARETARQTFDPTPTPVAESASNLMKIVLVVGLLGAMMLIALAGAGGLIYFNRGSRPTQIENINNNKAKPSPSAEPSADQTNTLRDQIANLEKRLNEQKKGSPGANVPASVPPANPSTMTTIAKANSPADGFLALRSLPNSEAGERITKIPHGATVLVGACGPVTRPVKRSGRWCQANYNGQTGWVFDGYLSY